MGLWGLVLFWRVWQSLGVVMVAVDVVQLNKNFSTPFRGREVQAVRDLSVQVQEGEVYGLLGPNGSGKSTTMKILLGILRASSGRCEIFGLSSDSARSRAQVGYVPENPYFYKHLDAQETLRFYGELAGVRGKRLKRRIDELLELVDMEDARKRRVGGYSKGMLQRIGLASALLHEPRVLLLDEPTAGVDPVGSRVIRDLIMRLKEQGITILLSSHLLEQVQEVCDRVGILARGKMVRQGTIEDLLAIEQQRELVLEDLDEQEFGRLRELAQQRGARVVRAGKPKTTLERLFVEVAQEDERRQRAERRAENGDGSVDSADEMKEGLQR